MNFGPEWMRRFPAKTTSASAHSSQHDLLPRAPSPLQDWGQLAAQSAGAAMAPGAVGGGNPTGPAFSYSSVAATNARSLNGPSSTSLSSGSYETPLSESIASDTLNPFKYSKDLMLSLFKPVGFPIEFERHEYATSEDALMPMSSQPFSDQEIKVRFILSGSVNSEVARRAVQPGEGGQERSQGQRRESLSNNEHSKDRDHAGRHDRSDRSTQSRNHDSKHQQGSSARPRHLNTEDRSHSFKRTEQGSRDQEDGLWNSPVRNTLGSFDSNGVFRVVHERDESLEPVTDSKGTSLEPEEPNQPSSTSHQAPTSSDPGSSPSDVGLESSHSGSHSLLNGASNSDAFSFAGNPISGSLDMKPVREESNFAPFSSSHAPGFNSGPAYDPAPAELSKWLYRDPSGNVQGPFASEEMHEWYKGGFFTMDLLVKREQDANFEPLGALIRKIGSDEKPFLLADLQAAVPLVRPNLSLAQNRQGSGLGHFNSSSWGGISAPSTPGTPSFGVDRMFQQQQQQQHSSGDLLGGSGNPLQHQQQQQQPTQDSFSGLDQKWNSGLFGPSQGLDSNVGGAGGWAGDAFTRSSMGNLGGPQTPLGGSFMSQQGRLLNQQLERQQYMQLLQRQIQMQHILHQQQFMAAQQQFGNDPHALSSLLAQQQAQQRQLQMRLQQVQHMGFHGVGGVTTPGGSAMPWGGLGQQPSSPWSSSIIQPSSDNYFEYGNGDNNNSGHSTMQLQQQQHQQQQRDQSQSFTQQTQQQPQQQHQDAQEQHVSKPAEVEDSVQAVAQNLEKLEFADASHQEMDQQTHQVPAASVVEPTQGDVREEPALAEHHETAVEEVKEEEKIDPVVVEEKKVKAEEHQSKEESQQETFESETKEEHETEFDGEQDDSKSAITEDASEDVPSESGWGTAPEQQQQPRVIKAVPAPWAKPSKTDDASEKKAPTLREIQEMEAKRAEETRAAERQAQVAAATAGVLDFGKGLGGTPWQTASATKKKTLREIQEEEEAALKRARSTQAAAQPVASAPVSSTGLAGIIASGTGSANKRYSDSVGPKPVVASANAGPWGTTSSAIAAKPLSMSRTTSAYASATSLSSSTASSPVVRAVDTNSWIEVDNKRGNKPSIETPAPAPAPAPVVRAPAHNVNRNSDEPRPASEEFLRWCRQALKGLQNVVLEDFIQMLLSFPLNPDPMTVEIIQDSIYANSQSLNGRQFADEFIKRRKADAYPNGMGPASATPANSGISNASSGGHDSSFKVVSKKGKKKN
ncbi:hypothetical protein KI688_010839 [Linnemannia hyalina]|uniref:GYF domain-containing protein n=1 Tax=Linnemannia hyalina TaxID=64524 RepID=A0A9P7XZ76_9FUNG|nr:hypothetical protein KI688_010839 [Linnemannia hyalina]